MMNDNGVKWLSTQRLAELLSELPEDSRVAVNAVGNLIIKDADKRYIGYVDFSEDGCVDIYE